MKDVRNKQLRNKLDKLGIKDVVLNFDKGFVVVWSEDELTDDILHYTDNSIETRIFADYTVDEWVEMIKNIFDDGLENYENKGFQRNSNGHIVIGSKIKNLEEDFDRESVIKSMRDCFEYSEAQHSQIGIFWYDVNKDELFGVNKVDSEHFEFKPSRDGLVKMYDKLHKDIWMKEFRHGKDDRFVGDYTKVPRGRVAEYKDQGFVVYVGDWIDEYPSAKKEIIYEFELPSDVEFRKDHHWNLGNGWSDELI